MAIDFATVSGDVVNVDLRVSAWVAFAHWAVLGSRIDVIAMFINAIIVVCRGNEVYVVTVAAAGMTRDAVQNRRAVHQVTHVLLQSIQAGFVGHRFPVN